MKRRTSFVDLQPSGPDLAGRGVGSDRVVYPADKEWRIVDLRPFGVDCIPVLGRSSYKTLRDGLEMHVHSGYVEISLCLRGHIRYETNDGEQWILPGQMYVSQPTQLHRRCNNPKGMLLYRILFAVPKRERTVLGLSPVETRTLANAIASVPQIVTCHSDRIRKAFERLFELCATSGGTPALRRLEMKTAALELLVAIARESGRPSAVSVWRHPQIEAIAAEMGSNPCVDYDPDRLAARAHLSRAAFFDTFKRITGLSPHAYLVYIRVSRSREDLWRGLKVAAVANKYRFRSSQHFATVFKRITGLTPGACRRRAECLH